MPYELANNPIRVSFAMLLYGIADVSNTLSMNCCFNAYIKRLLSNFQQLANLLINLTYTKRICRVSTKTVHVCSTIHRYNITILQHHITRHPMHHLLIDRSTNGSWERSPIGIGETLESRYSPMISYELISYLVKLASCNPWFDSLGNLRQGLSHQKITLAEQLNFIIRLKKYHLPLINKQRYLHYVP